ncbi:hypothetical protein EV121DRAFT_289432 [Schizophyllum commune]
MSALARTLFQRNGPAPRDFPPTDTPPGTPGSTQPVTPLSEDAMTREPSQAASTSATPALASTSRDPVDPRHVGSQPFPTNVPSNSDPHALARGLSSMRPGPPRFVDGAPTQASTTHTSTSTTPTAAPLPSRFKRLTSRISSPLKPPLNALTSALSPLQHAYTHLTPAITLTLENSGSVARDHLASERTFLAYTRTSLVIASTGVALVQLFTISAETRASDSSSTVAFQPTSPRLARWARPLGAATIAFGIFVLAVGLARYLTIQSALVRGTFPAARLVVVAISIGLCVLVGVVFGGLVGGG